MDFFLAVRNSNALVKANQEWGDCGPRHSKDPLGVGKIAWFGTAACRKRKTKLHWNKE